MARIAVSAPSHSKATATNPTSPGPDDESVNPTSGVPTSAVEFAAVFTTPAAVAGASGRSAAAPAKAGTNGTPRGHAHQSGSGYRHHG